MDLPRIWSFRKFRILKIASIWGRRPNSPDFGTNPASNRPIEAPPAIGSGGRTMLPAGSFAHSRHLFGIRPSKSGPKLRGFPPSAQPNWGNCWPQLKSPNGSLVPAVRRTIGHPPVAPGRCHAFPTGSFANFEFLRNPSFPETFQ